MLLAALAFVSFMLAIGIYGSRRVALVVASFASVVVFLECARVLPSPSWEKKPPAICWEDAKGVDVLRAVPRKFCIPKLLDGYIGKS